MWLARYLRSVVLVDSGDPRNWQTRGINGYLGLPNVTPAALRGAGRDEARRWGATLIDGCVSTMYKDGDEHFRLALENGAELESRRVLLAFGVKDIWPDIPGLRAHLRSHGVPLSRLRRPRDARKEDRRRGHGTKAVGLALALATWTRELVICTNGHDPDLTEHLLKQLDTLNIPVLVARVSWPSTKNARSRPRARRRYAPRLRAALFFDRPLTLPMTSRNDWGASATMMGAS